MRGAVICFGRSGECREVAQELAEALREVGHEVDLLLTDSNKDLMPAYMFIALGSSLKANRLLPASVRRTIKRLDDNWKGIPFFAFGVESAVPKSISGHRAADIINESLIAKGLRSIAPPLTILVEDAKGNFASGELNRAHRFSLEVGSTLNEIGERGFGKVTFIERALKAYKPVRYRPGRRKAC